MEITMQWWDVADDLWYALQLRLAAAGDFGSLLGRLLFVSLGLLLTL